MKKILCFLFAIIMLSTSVIFSGCSGNSNSKTHASSSSLKPEKTTNSNSTKLLTDYFNSFTEGDNPLYGTWQMKGFDYVSYIFRNDNLAEMAMGAEGNFTSLTIDTDKKTLSVSFILGLNGTYGYSLSDDEKTLTLTLDGEKTVLTKQKDYNFIPKAPKKPAIDKNIIGWWQSEDQLIYYFGGDGIMYSNQISMETCYTYSAKNGKIKAIYDYAGDVKTEFKYSYKNGKLTIDGDKFKPYDPLS